MTIVKVCGITRSDDAVDAVRAGADWIGLNFWPQSKRYIQPTDAVDVVFAARAAGYVAVVGVFVNQTRALISEIVSTVGLDRVQLHGDETPEDCAALGGDVIKALSMASAADVARIADYPCQTVLIDTPTAGYGGSGRTFDWSLARDAVATGKRVVLAGGLNADNVAAAVAEVAPYGVDVASGVEASPGVKDSELVRRFVAAAKGRQ